MAAKWGRIWLAGGQISVFATRVEIADFRLFFCILLIFGPCPLMDKNRGHAHCIRDVGGYLVVMLVKTQ